MTLLLHSRNPLMQTLWRSPHEPERKIYCSKPLGYDFHFECLPLPVQARSVVMPVSIYLALTSAVGPSSRPFICIPVAVWDGDGSTWCKEGLKLRLSGIAACELVNRCRAEHPCSVALRQRCARWSRRTLRQQHGK